MTKTYCFIRILHILVMYCVYCSILYFNNYIDIDVRIVI